MVIGYNSPIGTIAIEMHDGVLSRIEFDSPRDASSDFPDSLHKTKLWLDIFFSGRNPGFIPPYEISCSPFERKVYDILLEIPYGHVMTYKEIAREISPSMSAQAVGGAVGRNPLPLVIPCHRVVAAGGRLGGFSPGLEIKKQLLSLEGLGIFR